MRLPTFRTLIGMGTVHRHPAAPALRPTLGAFAADLDARRYRCPSYLDRAIGQLLDSDGPTRILTITGRGGIGKSAALREIGRRSRAAGREVVALDGRVDDVLAAIDGVSGAAADGRATTILVDEAGALGALVRGLGAALAALPDDTRVVIAGRTVPNDWLSGELTGVARGVRLESLDQVVAEEILIDYGVTEPEARASITDWAGGLPLAMVLGALATVETAPDLQPSVAAQRAGIDGLLAHLVEPALAELDPELLAVLALSCGIDTALLSALFADRAATLATQLGACSLLETVGSRRFLHPVLADLLAEQLRTEEPGRATATILRLAAHEHDRAVAGESAALVRLAALVRDPLLRAAMGPTAMSGYYADVWRDPDVIVVGPAIEKMHPGLWGLLRPWVDEGMRVVRRQDGHPVALVAVLALAEARDVSGPRRRLIAPLLAFAEEQGLDARTVVSAVQLTFDDLGEPQAAWVRNATGLAQSGLANPRMDVVNVLGAAPAEERMLADWGYQAVPTLARVEDGVPITTWSLDAGAGGLAAVLHSAVVAEQGGVVSARAAEEGDLVAALESLHSDGVLASLAIAPSGVAAADAAAQVRAWVRGEVAARLSDEPALLELVQLRYLTPAASHQSVMRATYLSRATYFRRLRKARELLGATAGAAASDRAAELVGSAEE